MPYKLTLHGISCHTILQNLNGNRTFLFILINTESIYILIASTHSVID